MNPSDEIIVSKPPTNPLRQVIKSNACPLRFTAAAGTKLAGTDERATVIIVTAPATLQLYLLSLRAT